MKKPRLFSPSHRNNFGKNIRSPRLDETKHYKTVSWTRYRERYLRVNDKCYACGEKSEVVDHVTPHHGDIVLFEKNDNHIPLCEVCHNRVTALFDRRHRSGDLGLPKLKWLSDQRTARGLTFKVKVLPYRK